MSLCGTTDQLKIELLSQWKLEAESRNTAGKSATGGGYKKMKLDSIQPCKTKVLRFRV